MTPPPTHDNIIGLVESGAMAERLKALVLKTSDTERYRGFDLTWRSTQVAEGAPLLRE